jgi:hypothetical protein
MSRSRCCTKRFSASFSREILSNGEERQRDRVPLGKRHRTMDRDVINGMGRLHR